MIKAQEISLAGERLVLLPERAAWLPDRRALLVSDVHLGKELVFRRQGIPIPDGPTGADLQRLKALCENLGVRHLWILGDLVHGQLNASLLQQINDWARALGPVEVNLVAGNHDMREINRLRELPFHHCRTGCLGALQLVHDAHDSRSDLCIVAGHVHPATRVYVGRHKALRVPSFVLEGSQLILPAFGEFTGGFDIVAGEGRALFPIVGGEVVRL